MLNKKWSSLNDENETGGVKRGHFAQYFAEMQLMLKGFETYKPTVDDRGIDLVIRNKNKMFFTIQVKSVTGDVNIKITRNKFDINDQQHYLIAIKFVDDNEPELYIIPSTRWNNPDNVFYDSGENNNEPQFGLRLTKANFNVLQEYIFENYIYKLQDEK